MVTQTSNIKGSRDPFLIEKLLGYDDSFYKKHIGNDIASDIALKFVQKEAPAKEPNVAGKQD